MTDIVETITQICDICKEGYICEHNHTLNKIEFDRAEAKVAKRDRFMASEHDPLLLDYNSIHVIVRMDEEQAWSGHHLDRNEVILLRDWLNVWLDKTMSY